MMMHRHRIGSAFLTLSSTSFSNILNAVRKRLASLIRSRSKASSSIHARLGSRIDDGTPGTAVGMYRLNIRYCLHRDSDEIDSESASDGGNCDDERTPEWMASTIARVCSKDIREPTPYLPPTQPVLTSQQAVLCSRILSANILA